VTNSSPSSLLFLLVHWYLGLRVSRHTCVSRYELHLDRFLVLSCEPKLGFRASFRYPTVSCRNELHGSYRSIRPASTASLVHLKLLVLSECVSVLLAFVMAAILKNFVFFDMGAEESECKGHYQRRRRSRSRGCALH